MISLVVNDRGMKNSLLIRVLGVVAILMLILTALAPVAYVLAPQITQPVEQPST